METEKYLDSDVIVLPTFPCRSCMERKGREGRERETTRLLIYKLNMNHHFMAFPPAVSLSSSFF